MRNRLYQIIEPASDNLPSKIYDFFIMLTIIVSVVPLAFKEHHIAFDIIEYVTVSIFIIDYLLRLVTADLKLERSTLSFFLYPITPMALIDLLSILPSLTVLNGSLKLLRLFRFLRAMKVFRTLKFLRYSKSFEIIVSVFKRQRRVLSAVFTMAVAYILVSALIIYNVEPESFETFFDAVYWATVSLTTVGYGDIYPVSVMGRIITMLSSILGIAIVALPAGIITAGYMAEIQAENENKGS